MHLTHLIVDDFFSEPHRVREAALSLDYPPRAEGAAYPGRNARHPLVLEGIERLIGDLVHERLVPARNSSHSIPRLALDGADRKASVHIDRNHWSVMIYLTLDEHCRGGTHFFRHRKTGLDRAPLFPGEAEAAGYPNADAAVTDILETGANDRSQWEETMMIPMKFNRMVLFRGYIWHDAGVSFGTGPANGRLILPLFFENAAVR
ncbi:DUF6445 family protein [Maricaulis sp.]|jgi:hypothetical protein|uniref:DUF6445 family protein n=1 Tax=Maricaulis sp. TaxID=1486257 RepID=UPI00260577C4|nr:DUF6445 family protein [Maricaulis sp.]